MRDDLGQVAIQEFAGIKLEAHERVMARSHGSWACWGGRWWNKGQHIRNGQSRSWGVDFHQRADYLMMLIVFQ
jgi:hypothetical protein